MGGDAGIAGAPPCRPDGVLVVDKPEGPTSHDVVARVRRALHTRQIGHTGTLDPMATGVLALLVGRATRLAQFLSRDEKAYSLRLRLGLTTDSWDRTGIVLTRLEPGAILPDAAAIERALAGFVGEHEQVPPPFSAKKIAGVRAHELARRGRDVTMAPARVTLHSARIDGVHLPFVDLRVTCSAGFYVRALVENLGRQLGCGACLDSLRRTASGGFTVAAAVPLDRVEERPERALEHLVPLERVLPDLPAVVLNETGVKRAIHGNEVGPGDWTPGSAASSSSSPDPSSAGLPLSSWDPTSTGSRAVRLLDAAGRLVAVARPAGRPGVLHPAVVLK